LTIPDTSAIAAAAAVVFSAALVSSIAGFAFSALAGAPLLHLLEDPVRTVGVMVACSIAMQCYGVWALRASIDWRRLWPFITAGAVTAPVGVWLLVRAPAQLFGLGLGAFLVAYGLYMALRSEPPTLRGNAMIDAAAGALGGLVGGLAGFPGSFVTIWCGMRGWSKERQRAVYQPYILAMQVETLVCLRLGAASAISVDMLVVFVPVALVAAWAGLAMFRRLTTRQFGVVVYCLLVASGVALVGGAL
jgi:uncharacterized membrane protein YfcA